MNRPDRPLGCSHLIRLAGLPVDVWTDAGSPEFFREVRELNETSEYYLRLGVEFADSLGTKLVSQPWLSREDRGLVLAVRRKAHKGITLKERESSRLANLLEHSPDESVRELAQQFVRFCNAEQSLTKQQQHLSSELPVAQSRVIGYACSRIDASNSGIEALIKQTYSTAPTSHASTQKQGAVTNRAHHHARYAIQMITRGATKSNPRGWLGHVAVLPVLPGFDRYSSLTAQPRFAIELTNNVHYERYNAWRPALEQERPDLHVSLSALHWIRDEHVEFLVSDPLNPSRMVEVTMKRSELLKSICDCLAGGAVPLSELHSALTDGDPEQRQLLNRFLEHLTDTGVLQISVSPESSVFNVDFEKEQDGVEEFKTDSNRQDSVYIDVYRECTGGLSRTACLRLQQLCAQTLRILQLITADQAKPTVSAAVAANKTLPLLDVLKGVLEDETRAHVPWRSPSAWPQPDRQDSGYARLVSWLKAQSFKDEPINISSAVLDQCGAERGDIEWPLDCLLRVADAQAPYLAVLDQIFPAGTMDARFISALRGFGQNVSQADYYSQFLRAVEANTGYKFVEILAPPLSERAANAVRRPIYTRAWTGDPDIRPYWTSAGELPEYINLSEIELRFGTRLHAETPAGPIWPIYHATRSPLPPWSSVFELLMASAPQVFSWKPLRLYQSLDLFPERVFMPRVTIEDELVLCCAQWRITTAELWDSAADDFSKVRALERLRRRRGMPRFVFLSAKGSVRPIACDLENLESILLIEKLTRPDAQLIATEMLPAPDQLLVQDGNSPRRFVSELLLRLPCDESPLEMAARVSSRISLDSIPWFSASPHTPAADLRVS